MTLPKPLQGWTRGLSWNYLALAVAAVAGLLTTLVVAGGYGPSGLGVFSQTLTFFVLVGQVAVFGIHYAVLHEVSGLAGRNDQRNLLNVAFTSAIPISLLASLAAFLLAPVVGALVQSEVLVTSLRYASLALVFHALAKIVSAAHNGARQMAQLAAVNAARFVALFLSAVLISLAGLPEESLGLVLVGSELAALTVALLTWGGVRLRVDLIEVRELISYGIRATPAAITVEVNSRVDIISLGILTSDASVGIYALAATVYEGLLQVFVVLRNQVNPLVSASIKERRFTDLESFQRKLAPWTASVTALAILASLLLFDLAVDLLGLDPAFASARGPLVILLVGMLVASPVLPFDQTLVVSGQPAAQSVVVAISVTINIVLNVLLVPTLELYGAAIATACALVALAVGIVQRSNSLLGVRLKLFPLPVLEPSQ